jgi:DNA-binding CsgD family transcriptional regulator
VLALIGSGCSSAAIAARLGIAISTVETHVRTSMQKLDARTRLHAAALASSLEPRGHEGPNGLERPTLALVRLLAHGRTVSDAAAILGLSRRTATRRLTQARRRLGVRTNAEVVLIAVGAAPTETRRLRPLPARPPL